MHLSIIWRNFKNRNRVCVGGNDLLILKRKKKKSKLLRCLGHMLEEYQLFAHSSINLYISIEQSSWTELNWSRSVPFSRSVMSDSLQPHESQHARPPCPSLAPGVYSNSCPSSPCCHPAILFSFVPFSSRPQRLPASGSFPMS